MMDEPVPKPPNEDTPAQVPKEPGRICVKCRMAMPADRGAVIDHRFICDQCRNTPPRVGRP